MKLECSLNEGLCNVKWSLSLHCRLKFVWHLCDSAPLSKPLTIIMSFGELPWCKFPGERSHLPGSSFRGRRNFVD